MTVDVEPARSRANEGSDVTAEELHYVLDRIPRGPLGLSALGGVSNEELCRLFVEAADMTKGRMSHAGSVHPHA